MTFCYYKVVGLVLLFAPCVCEAQSIRQTPTSTNVNIPENSALQINYQLGQQSGQLQAISSRLDKIEDKTERIQGDVDKISRAMDRYEFITSIFRFGLGNVITAAIVAIVGYLVTRKVKQRFPETTSPTPPATS